MFLVLAVCLLVAYLIWKSTVKPKNFPPGPPRWPVVGGFFQMTGDNPNGPSLFHGSRRAIKQYGDIFGYYLGRKPVVMVADIEVMRELFKREDVTSRPPVRPMNELKIGHDAEELDGRSPGIIFSAGRYWRDQRRFVLRHLRDFGFGRNSMEGMFLVEVEKLCRSYQEKEGQRFVLNLSVNISIVNALWTILVGDAFDLDDPKLLQVTKLLDDTIKKSSLSLSPIASLMPIPAMAKLPVLRTLSNFDRSKKMIDSIYGMITPYIKDHRLTFQRDQPRDLMDLILQETEDTTDEGSPFFGKKGEAVLYNVFFDLFIAGMETTSSSLLWTFLYLIHHPDKQKKVHKELDKVVGRDRWPSFDDQDQMPYVNAVLHESFRISGLVYVGVPHYTTQEVDVKGLTIPKDTLVFGCIHHMMNDPKYWNEPEVFKPERFIDAKTGKFTPNDRVIPFGTGKRVCLGQSLAEKEFFMFFVGVMQKFEIFGAPGEELPSYGVESSSPMGLVRAPPVYQVVMKSRMG